MIADPAAGRILRAKYLDWCSARVADRFLDLTPDEIYELAHDALAEDVASVAGGVSPDSAEMSPPPGAHSWLEVGAESYRSLVQRATEALSARIDLPSFEEWSTAYAEAPEEFDREMLGFWREAAGDEVEIRGGNGT